MSFRAGVPFNFVIGYNAAIIGNLTFKKKTRLADNDNEKDRSIFNLATIHSLYLIGIRRIHLFRLIQVPLQITNFVN